MHTPQTIVVIGAGDAGKVIAKGLAGGKDKVILCDENMQKATEAANKLKQLYPLYDIEAMACFFDAAWEADVLVLTVSCTDLPKVAEKIKEVANQKIVITTSADWESIQELLPNSKVVGAFENATPLHEEPEINFVLKGRNKEALETSEALMKRIKVNAVILPAS